MIVRNTALAGLALLVAGLVGCDNQNAAPEQTTAKTAAPNATVTQKPPAPPTAAQNPMPSATGAGVANVDTTHGETDFSKMAALNDNQIAAAVTALNEGEINQAQVAITTTKDENVKKFAQHMIDEHTTWLKAAADTAKKAKLEPADSEISKKLKDDSNALVKMLGSVKGADFDKAYVDAQVKNHQSALDLIDQRLSKDVKNDDLKKALDDVKPKIASHLAMAKSLQNDLANGGSVGAKTERRVEEPGKTGADKDKGGKDMPPGHKMPGNSPMTPENTHPKK